MYKIKISKNNQATNQAEFSTEAELQAWFEKEKANNSFGENGHQERTNQVYDEQHNFVSEDVVDIPCEYTYEIIDLSSEVARQSILNQIAELEASVTTRRIREAVISGDKTFIESVDAQIITLRATL